MTTLSIKSHSIEIFDGERENFFTRIRENKPKHIILKDLDLTHSRFFINKIADCLDIETITLDGCTIESKNLELLMSHKAMEVFNTTITGGPIEYIDDITSTPMGTQIEIRPASELALKRAPLPSAALKELNENTDSYGQFLVNDAQDSLKKMQSILVNELGYLFDNIQDDEEYNICKIFKSAFLNNISDIVLKLKKFEDDKNPTNYKSLNDSYISCCCTLQQFTKWCSPEGEKQEELAPETPEMAAITSETPVLEDLLIEPSFEEVAFAEPSCNRHTSNEQLD